MRLQICENDRPEGMRHAYRLFFSGDKCMRVCIHTYVTYVHVICIYVCAKTPYPSLSNYHQLSL